MLPNLKLDGDTLRQLGSRPGAIAGPLATAQLSRRILVIHGVLTAVEEDYLELFQTARLAESRQVLADAQRADRDAVNAVLLLPTVGTWAMRCGHFLSTSPAAGEITDVIGHFGALAAAAALRAGLRFEVTARVPADQNLMFPSLGLARLDTGPAWIRASSPDGITLELHGPGRGGGLTIRPNSPETERWRPLRQLRSEANGLAVALYLDDIDPYRRHHLPPLAERLAPDELVRWARQLDDAWSAIVSRQPDEARAISAGMAALVPLKHDPRAPSVSATAKPAVGALGLTRPATPEALAEALIHEHRHSLLWAILAVAPLVERESSTTLLYAPWRSDPRPALGLLHGAFAFLGLLRYWAARSASGPPESRRSAAFELALWRHGVRVAIEQLTTSGLLTPQGEALVEGMTSALEEMDDCPVSADLRSMAEDAALDQHLAWRLRNHQPAQDSVHDCCAAWRHGQPRPALGAAKLIDNGARGAGAPRLALFRRYLVHPERFRVGRAEAANSNAATAADLHLVTGDWKRAAELYANAIADRPQASALWAGLTLTWQRLGHPGAEFLTANPEVLPAIYACVVACSGAEPDVIALTDWFASSSEW